MTRRRTPGLRREEVAQRSNVSATWYTWLEQGRGGAPSADVLDRLARGLALTEVEREHLFLLAQNRPPEVKYQEAPDITPQLQRVLDSFEFSPAYIRTPEWDVLAGNRAAMAVFVQGEAKSPVRFNVLENFFSEDQDHAETAGWESVARAVVATFRTETARTGYSQRAKALVEKLSAAYPKFRKLWLEHDLSNNFEGIKTLHISTSGPITFEYATFAVDGKPNLSLVVFNPATPEDRARMRSLLG
jgi:transcriptional regulator with XRE-family HTH domain